MSQLSEVAICILCCMGLLTWTHVALFRGPPAFESDDSIPEHWKEKKRHSHRRCFLQCHRSYVWGMVLIGLEGTAILGIITWKTLEIVGAT